MNRGEIAVAVLGVLGTFLLPWPGGGTAITAGELQAVEKQAHAASCDVRMGLSGRGAASQGSAKSVGRASAALERGRSG